MSSLTESNRGVLDATERFSEVLFGLIMVLTFTGTLSATGAGRDEVRTMLVGALGCNLAWGLVDAVMYVIGEVAHRGRGNVLLRELRRTSDPVAARQMIRAGLPGRIAAVIGDGELDSIRKGLVALPEPPRYAVPSIRDFVGAAGVFLLVFLSTFPVAVPFMLVDDAHQALRISNVIALVMLFLLGLSLARSTGGSPVRMGLGMLLLGVVLVAITIALGG
jgi:hypothetical protein